MPKTVVDVNLPIEFSEVCEVVYQDLLGTNGRSLSQTFIDANGVFDPTYVSSGGYTKDSLLDFRGYTQASIDGTHRVIANYTGSIWVSHDAGNTWAIPTGNPTSTWSSVAISDNGVYILVGASSNATSYKSNNSGASFSSISGGYWLYSDMSSTGEYQVQANSSTGQVRISSDYGANWTTKTVLSATAQEVAISGNGVYIIVGYVNGNTYISSNYGSTFSVMGSLIDCGDIAISDTGQYISIISNYNGTRELWQSSNYGSSFTRKLSTFNAFNYVAMNKSGKDQYTSIYTVTGYNFHSPDYGVTWNQINPFLNTNIYDLVVGYSGIYGVFISPPSGTEIIKDFSSNLNTVTSNNTFKTISLTTPNIAISRGYEGTLSAPSLSFVSSTANSITLSWNAIASATSYTLYWGITGGYTSFQNVGTVLTYQVTGLTESTSYNFYIIASNGDINSTNSNVIVQSTNAATATLTLSVTDLAFTGGLDSQSFDIYSSGQTWSISSNQTWCTIDTVPNNTGNQTIWLTCEANPSTTSTRKATITVTGSITGAIYLYATQAVGGGPV